MTALQSAQHALAERNDTGYTAGQVFDLMEPVVADLESANAEIERLKAVLTEDQEREAFEEWFKRSFPIRNPIDYLRKNRNGNYLDDFARDRWLVWKARAALQKEK